MRPMTGMMTIVVDGMVTLVPIFNTKIDYKWMFTKDFLTSVAPGVVLQCVSYGNLGSNLRGGGLEKTKISENPWNVHLFQTGIDRHPFHQQNWPINRDQ